MYDFNLSECYEIMFVLERRVQLYFVMGSIGFIQCLLFEDGQIVIGLWWMFDNYFVIGKVRV